MHYFSAQLLTTANSHWTKYMLEIQQRISSAATVAFRLRSHRHESEFPITTHTRVERSRSLVRACLLTISSEIVSSECFAKNNNILLHR